MGGQTTLLTYADARFRKGHETMLASARQVGFDHVIAAGPEDWHCTAFEAESLETLHRARGEGYWLWKPWRIGPELEKFAPDDVLLCCDASLDGFCCFDGFSQALVDCLRQSSQGFLIGPVIHQRGPLRNWTKRDARLLLDCDRPGIIERPLVQATWSLWQNRGGAPEFLRQWLAACCEARALNEQPNALELPNHVGFVDHRHDQSLLSLACRDNWDVLDLRNTGLFGIMARRPQALMTHRFLKAPRNADSLLAGHGALATFAREALKDRWRRTFGERRGQ